jgi:hypothetical protein
MREAAEAGDDVAMLDGDLRHLGIVERSEQRAAHLLIAERFAVLERHVEERPQGETEGCRIEPRQRDLRRLHRLGVAFEGARRAAMHVAGELVAQKDQRQGSVGRLPPVIQTAGDRPLDQSRKALADLGVELGRTSPPGVARLAVVGMVERQEPEIEDIADGRGRSHDLTVSRLFSPISQANRVDVG